MIQQPSVLLADGVDENVLLIIQLLSDLPVACIHAETSSEIIPLARQHQPAVILLASALDEQDGYTMLNLLRAAPETRHLPVIFMPSSMAEKPMNLHRELLDTAHIIPKPVDTKRLRGMVQFFERLYEHREALAGLGGEKNQTLIESEEEGVIAVDADGRIRFLNAAAERFLQVKVTDMFGQYIESIFEDRADHFESKWSDHPITKILNSDQILQVDSASFWRKDGVQISVKFAAIPITNIEGIQIVVAFRVLKDTREGKDKIQKLANVDALTGLPSRSRICEALEAIIDQSARESRHFGVLFIDLDHFRHINEALGHEHGDELLKLVAERLRLLIRRDDAIGRMEGEEFAVILTTLDHPQGAASVAAKIIEKIREPFLLAGHEIYTGCSVGVAVYPNCGDDPEALLKNAEIAMERAKTLGRNNFQFFTGSMNKERNEMLALERDIHRGLVENEFVTELVTHMDNRLEQVTALEACLRWQHPDKGVLDQNYYGSAAEEAGIGRELAMILWQESCQQLQVLNEQSVQGDIPCIIPLPSSLLAMEGLAAWLVETVSHCDVEPRQILVAVSESVISLRGAYPTQVLTEIQANGFGMLLDQFATGYASLEMLRSVSYEAVKVSDLLVARLGLSRTDEAVVDAALYLAHNLGLQVFANGVDTQEQLTFLRERRCEWVQGALVEEKQTSAALPKNTIDLNIKFQKR